MTESRKFDTIRQRAGFLAAARGLKASMPSLVLQARARNDGDPAARIGFTCSKKVGNAVARNRAKRRLREAAAHVLTSSARAGWDYVLIGRVETTASLPFARLLDDLASAIKRVHARGEARR